jgi:hypothetical protein
MWPFYYISSESVDVNLLRSLENLENTVDSQHMFAMNLQSNFEIVEREYEELKEDAREALAHVERLQKRLETADRSLVLLRRELSETVDLLRENKDTTQSQIMKTRRLEEKIQEIQRKNKQFFLRKWLERLIPIILSAVSFLLIGLTYLFSFCRRRKAPVEQARPAAVQIQASLSDEESESESDE